ncbi:MAG: DUF5108 domain-containing protein [Rikenellaceae bacterium]|nr:DUF5108 domain-containing protein [Rikenellaceae bacterium]
MKHLMKLYALILVLLCSCSDPYKGSTYQVYDVNPISTYLDSNPDKFSEWVEVLRYADLYNAINQASEFFTAFVPDNEAVAEYYRNKNVSSIEQLGKDFAIDLVKFHVIHDTVNYDTFIQGGKLESKTLSDDYLTVSWGEDGVNSVYINNEALVEPPVTAIETSNGYIYVLKGVLSPLVESVYERIEQNEDQYTIFKEVLELTSWSDSLNVIYDEIRQSDGTYVQQNRNYTLLAVPDQSFRSSGINSLADLIADLEADSDYTDPENDLFRYAAYHILAGNYSLLELQNFSSKDKIKLMTTLSENVIQITEESEDEQLYINHEGGEKVWAQFLEETSDLKAKNGVIHQLDAYLPIWESITPVEVIWDFCDYPEIASYVANYGSAYGGGELEYQTITASEGYIEISYLSCFTVNAPNPSSGSSYPKVQYRTTKTGSAWTSMQYHDHMILNLGTNGYIEMTTPAIIAGKYKLTLTFSYATTQLFIRNQDSGSNGGEMRFTFDDDTENLSVTGKPYTTIQPGVSSPILSVETWEMFEEIEFTKTSTHKFRLTVLDPEASSSSQNYRIGIDHLLFEPISG